MCHPATPDDVIVSSLMTLEERLRGPSAGAANEDAGEAGGLCRKMLQLCDVHQQLLALQPPEVKQKAGRGGSGGGGGKGGAGSEVNLSSFAYLPEEQRVRLAGLLAACAQWTLPDLDQQQQQTFNKTGSQL